MQGYHIEDGEALHIKAHLHYGQYHKQLKSKVRQLKHHAAALSSPLLLPIIQEIRDESPADADKALLRDYFLTCQ